MESTYASKYNATTYIPTSSPAYSSENTTIKYTQTSSSDYSSQGNSTTSYKQTAASSYLSPGNTTTTYGPTSVSAFTTQENATTTYKQTSLSVYSSQGNATTTYLSNSTSQPGTPPVNTTLVPYNVTSNASLPTNRTCGGRCTINIPDAVLQYWWPATYTYAASSLQVATNSNGTPTAYSLVPVSGATLNVTDILSSSVSGAIPTFAPTPNVTINMQALVSTPTPAPTPVAASTTVVSVLAMAPIPTASTVNGTNATLSIPALSVITPGPPTVAVTDAAGRTVYVATSSTAFFYFSNYEVESEYRRTDRYGHVSCITATRTYNLSEPVVHPFPGNPNGLTTVSGDVDPSFVAGLPHATCVPGTWDAEPTVIIIIDITYVYVIPFRVSAPAPVAPMTSASVLQLPTGPPGDFVGVVEGSSQTTLLGPQSSPSAALRDMWTASDVLTHGLPPFAAFIAHYESSALTLEGPTIVSAESPPTHSPLVAHRGSSAITLIPDAPVTSATITLSGTPVLATLDTTIGEQPTAAPIGHIASVVGSAAKTQSAGSGAAAGGVVSVLGKGNAGSNAGSAAGGGVVGVLGSGSHGNGNGAKGSLSGSGSRSGSGSGESSGSSGSGSGHGSSGGSNGGSSSGSRSGSHSEPGGSSSGLSGSSNGAGSGGRTGSGGSTGNGGSGSSGGSGHGSGGRTGSGGSTGNGGSGSSGGSGHGSGSSSGGASGGNRGNSGGGSSGSSSGGHSGVGRGSNAGSSGPGNGVNEGGTGAGSNGGGSRDGAGTPGGSNGGGGSNNGGGSSNNGGGRGGSNGNSGTGGALQGNGNGGSNGRQGSGSEFLGAKPVITVGGSVFTGQSITQVVVGGRTIQAGAPAATVDGQSVSLLSSGNAIVVDGTTRLLPVPGAFPTTTNIAGLQVAETPGVGFVVDGKTVFPGGPGIVVKGTPISMNNNAVFVGSSKVALTGAMATPAGAGSFATSPQITINGHTYTANGKGQYILGPGKTLTPGGTVTMSGGAVVSLAPGNPTFYVVNGKTSSVAAPAITPAPSGIIRGVAYGSNGGATYVLGSQTLTPGGHITYKGSVVSLGEGGEFLVVNGVTTDLAGSGPSVAPALTVGGTVYRAQAGTHAYDIEGKILTPGGQIVADGTTISLNPSGSAVVINGVTSILPVAGGSGRSPASIAPILTFDGKTYTETGGKGSFIIQGHVLTAGGQIIVQGTTISLSPLDDYIVINGTTSPLAPNGGTFTAPLLTLAGHTYTALAGSDNFLIDGQILRAGGEITVSGTTISLAPNEQFVLVNGVKHPLSSPSFATAAGEDVAVLTFGGHDYTANAGGTFFIDDQELTAGGVITVDGVVISLAPNEVFAVVGGITETLIHETITQTGTASGRVGAGATPPAPIPLATKAAPVLDAAADRQPAIRFAAVAALALAIFLVSF
ncbi:MAG: hypothetical protein M1822_006780 [Bathelium mastoideum]|nr:MAG: hypothetical protein M1822_006780 [Bathelium mastoideum]